MTTEHTRTATDTAPSCGDVRDPGTGLPRVLATKCDTCIFRPGNRMHLSPGYRDHLVNQALARDSWIVCHATLPDTGHPVGSQAVCRGFWDMHAADSAGCRLALALGGPVVTPPSTAATPAATPAADHSGKDEPLTR